MYANTNRVPLSVAAWLAHDSYNYDSRPNHISATTLLKPLKQYILASRNRKNPDRKPVDISQLYQSRLGTAMHDGIERIWENQERRANALAKLGHGPDVINRIVVNPKPDQVLPKDAIVVHLEQRAEREIDGFIISGQLDFVAEGRLEDFKSTTVYTYINNTKDEDYILQGSLYRWLHRDIITEDTMAIQFLFRDWSKARATVTANYPFAPILEHKLPLRSLEDTEQFIRNKLSLIKEYWDAPEQDIPECTDKDLWRKDPVYKYFKTPGAKRSTKNYTNMAEAQDRVAKDGGEVIEQLGEVVACRYCDGFDLCKQKDRYLQTGLLNMGD